ncbi:NAD(P)H-dependent glycerol-3-phosphate dehydrogenase [Hutsoniella sourekii]
MKISVLGSGSWGSALAKVLAENGHSVMIWGRNQKVIDEINQRHTNSFYLPTNYQVLPESIQATTDLKQALANCELLLLVTPTQTIRSLMESLRSQLMEMTKQPIIVHATKGLELTSHLRVSQVIEQVMGDDLQQEVAVLSGPSHAEEVVRQDITTLTVASQNLRVATTVQGIFMNPYFRVYTNIDVIGVELGGALKNIIALASGILDGCGYGDNAKAALITRGLAEISRLGIEMGADPLTFSGLSGVGDLIVTCTSPHSRNYQAGLKFAEGKTTDQVGQEMTMVVEGMTTCQAAYELAKEHGVEMPITETLYQLLYQNQDLSTAVNRLMTRAGKQEASFDQHVKEDVDDE